tara:strand:- start:247 stop:558 length:312 start_codon:yes stop_codon:yes gene_type:complete
MKIAFIDHCSLNITSFSTYLDAKRKITYKFNTEKELNDFVELFPKYCKIKKSGCNSMKPENAFKFGAWVDLSSETNKVTGEVNETANKRIKKINSILKNLPNS